MEMRTFGRTGMQVSLFGFGCGAVGGLMVRGAPADQERAVARALEAGINYFDTAAMYGNGESEKNLGRVLARLKPNVIVGTKVRIPSADFGRIAAVVAESLEASLKRMGREQVDIFHLHNAITRAGGGESIAAKVVLDEVVPAFEALRRQGKTRFLGITAVGDTAALHQTRPRPRTQERRVTRVRIAVIGAGHLGRIHARLLGEMSHVELVGVADPLSAARDKVAADCGTTAFADYRQLVDRVDGAVIATPTRAHHTVALDFLRHGVPVFIEKPMAADLTEAEDLVRASRVHGALVQVGHIERFNPAFTTAVAHIQRPRYIEAVRASTFTGRSTDIGVVYDLMIHDIDLALSLAASPVARVSAMGIALLGRNEDVAQARLEFENGCVAHLSASRASFAPAPKRQMQVWSESGFALLDFDNRTAHVVRPCDAVREHRFDYEALSSEEKAGFKDKLFSDLLQLEMLDVPPRNALAEELEEFVAGIYERQPVRVTAEAGRTAVAVAELVLESIRTHQWDGRQDGSIGPMVAPEPSILRGPHWRTTPEPRPAHREAG